MYTPRQQQLAAVNKNFCINAATAVILLLQDRAYFVRTDIETQEKISSFVNRKLLNEVDETDVTLTDQMGQQLLLELFNVYKDYITENESLGQATGLIFKNPKHIHAVCDGLKRRLESLDVAWTNNKVCFDPINKNHAASVEDKLKAFEEDFEKDNAPLPARAPTAIEGIEKIYEKRSPLLLHPKTGVLLPFELVGTVSQYAITLLQRALLRLYAPEHVAPITENISEFLQREVDRVKLIQQLSKL
jgi:hypothetical protein